AVLYALDGHGRRHIFIPMTDDVAVVADRRSSGVHLAHRVLEEDDGRNGFIDISCEKAHLHSVFEYFAADVLNEIRQQPGNALLGCRRVLARWRELLSRGVTRLLSEAELAGLYGELWHLRELVGRDAAALAVWRGP